MVFAIGALVVVVIGQWLVIWRLLDRLLIQSNIPALGPVRVREPRSEPPEQPKRKPLFQIPLDR